MADNPNAVTCGGCNGDGRCTACGGDGFCSIFDRGYNDDKGACRRCGGSGVCPGCGGSGIIVVPVVSR